jgi:hypothetical protein
VKSELRDRFDGGGEAKVELLDYIEVSYKQRRPRSTLGQISPAAVERRAMTQAASMNGPRITLTARQDAERTRHAIAWARYWRTCHPR